MDFSVTAVTMLLALFILVSLCSAEHYWRVPHATVASQYHIRHIKQDYTMTPKEFTNKLQSICSSEPSCAGFTNDGTLVSNVATTQKSSKHQLYIKKDIAAPADSKVWPLPQTITTGSMSINLSPNFQFISNSIPDLEKILPW